MKVNWLLLGVLWVALALAHFMVHRSETPELQAFHGAFIGYLLFAAGWNLVTWEFPDLLTGLGFALAVAGGVLTPEGAGGAFLAGAELLALMAVINLVSVAADRARHGIGWGTVKLSATLGAVLGLGGGLGAVMGSFVLAAFFAIPAVLRGKLGAQEPFPIGAPLAAAAILVLLFADRLVGWLN